jgi:hypothetical protein
VQVDGLVEVDFASEIDVEEIDLATAKVHFTSTPKISAR